MSEVDRIRLTQELTDIVTAVWFDIDHRDGSGVSAYFTPDGTLTFSARTFHGRDEIDAVYAARAARGTRTSRHLVTNLHVTGADETAASAVSALVLFAQDGPPPHESAGPALVGDVHDEFVREVIDGRPRWLIRSRTITQLFTAPDTVLAVPTQ